MSRRPIRYDPARDFYVVLGVSVSASAEEIQQAFRRRAKELHPDRNPDRQAWATAAFQALNEAYDTLSDPARRRDYDLTRRPRAEPRPPYQADSSSRADGSWWGEDVARGSTSRRGPAWQKETWDYQAWTQQHAPPPPDVVPRSNPLQAVVDLLRSPYGPALRIMFVFIAMISLPFLTMNGLLVARPATPTLPVATAAVEIVPLPYSLPPEYTMPPPTCDNPAVTITSPAEGADVYPTFSVEGSATDPRFWEYRLDLAYLGAFPGENTRYEWTLIGRPSRQPVSGGVLVQTANMNALRSGYYLLRLTVQLDDGTFLSPCERTIVYPERGR